MPPEPASKPKPKLSVVSDEVYRLDRRHETTSQRVRRLQTEARILAREQIEALEAALMNIAALASEIAEGGEAYPAGVRDLSHRIADDLPQRAQTLEALMARIPEPRL